MARFEHNSFSCRRLQRLLTSCVVVPLAIVLHLGMLIAARQASIGEDSWAGELYPILLRLLVVELLLDQVDIVADFTWQCLTRRLVPGNLLHLGRSHVCGRMPAPMRRILRQPAHCLDGQVGDGATFVRPLGAS